MNTGEVWPIGKLQGWDKNPRTIQEKDFKRLVAQIKKHGVYKPLIVNQDGIIVGGNMRFKALQYLEVPEVWVSIVQTKDEAEMLEIALSDNDRAGSYDEEALAEMVALYDIDQELYTIDTGKMLSIKDLSNKYGPEPEEDEPPELEEGEADSKPGEIYQLGNHRLMCGDATADEAVQMLMDGKKADLVFLDPPYNVDYVGKTKDALKIQNDKMDDSQFFDFLFLAFRNAKEASRPGTVAYVCHADSEGLPFRQAFHDAGWTLKQCLIWLKQTMVMGRQDYQWKHEPILYGWLEGAAHYYVSDRTNTTVWEFDRPTSSKEYPTMKPVKLVGEAINNSSKPGDIVVDLFGGSGSTLIAAEQTGRICYTMELDPHYCDVIRKRYELFVQSKAE